MFSHLLNEAVSLESGKDNLSVYVSGTSSFMVGQYQFKDITDIIILFTAATEICYLAKQRQGKE